MTNSTHVPPIVSVMRSTSREWIVSDNSNYPGWKTELTPEEWESVTSASTRDDVMYTGMDGKRVNLMDGVVCCAGNNNEKPYVIVLPHMLVLLGVMDEETAYQSGTTPDRAATVQHDPTASGRKSWEARITDTAVFSSNAERSV